MYILVASSSSHRQAMYAEALVKLGHRVETAGNGIECVERLHAEKPDLLVLEAPLQWGGSDGVLEVVEQDLGPGVVPVIVLAVGSGSIDWFQLSRFRIDDFLFRVPTMHELGQAIDSVVGQSSNVGRNRHGHGRLSHGQLSNDRLNLSTTASSSGWNQTAAAASVAVLHR